MSNIDEEIERRLLQRLIEVVVLDFSLIPNTNLHNQEKDALISSLRESILNVTSENNDLMEANASLKQVYYSQPLRLGHARKVPFTAEVGPWQSFATSVSFRISPSTTVQ